MADKRSKLSHLTDDGRVHMVDVGDKATTKRSATATAFISMSAGTLTLIREGQIKKGDVLGVARIAGIQASKHTSNLIPLCHPLPITGCEVSCDQQEDGILITATVRCTGKTGVEMEALTAASVAALTIYDMVKGVQRDATISRIQLEKKSGGQTGDYQR